MGDEQQCFGMVPKLSCHATSKNEAYGVGLRGLSTFQCRGSKAKHNSHFQPGRIKQQEYGRVH